MYATLMLARDYDNNRLLLQSLNRRLNLLLSYFFILCFLSFVMVEVLSILLSSRTDANEMIVQTMGGQNSDSFRFWA
jgi:hypothetical protein